MTFAFLKMHGAANDFVVVDHRRPFLPEPVGPLVARLCDRRRGVGADGVLLLEADPEHDFAMRYLNADGGPADWCGNGARCLARRALDLGLGRDGRVRFRTAMGVQEGWRAGGPDTIAVHVGTLGGAPEPCRVEAADGRFDGVRFDAGVPHFVVPVEAVEAVPIERWGPALRRHPRFGAAGVNADFVAPLADGRVALRTFERGVEAETLACGSGAIAAAMWAAGRGATPPVRVRTAGGDTLEVSLRALEVGYDVTLIGPAEVAFAGEWTDDAHVSRQPKEV